MKNLIFSIALLFFLAACGGNTTRNNDTDEADVDSLRADDAQIPIDAAEFEEDTLNGDTIQ